MAKILYIKATPKKVENSWTLKMSEFFLAEYKKQNPDDIITELALYDENIAFLSEQDLHDMMQAEKGEFSRLVDQFLAHDKYVISAPLWNHSIPAILKAYIDRIIVVNKTFYYTDEGIQPVSVGKKAVFFMATGAVYSKGPLSEFEFGINYWNAIATTFLGLETKFQLLEGTELVAAEEIHKLFIAKLPELTREAAVF